MTDEELIEDARGDRRARVGRRRARVRWCSRSTTRSRSRRSSTTSTPATRGATPRGRHELDGRRSSTTPPARSSCGAARRVARRARSRRRSSPAARTTRRSSGRPFAAWPARCSPRTAATSPCGRLLRRDPPAGRRAGAADGDRGAARRSPSALDGTYLFVQGPPGRARPTAAPG